MDKDIVRILQEKLHNASHEDIFPGLDKDAEWANLSARLQKRKTIAFPVSLRYAAAVIAGLILGGWGTKLFNNPKQVNNRSVTVKAPLQQNTQIKDTASHYAVPAGLVKNEPVKAAHKQYTAKAVAPVVAPGTGTTFLNHETVADTPYKDIPVESPIAKAPARRLVHMLDVLDEDERTVLVPGNSTVQMHGFNRFYFVLSPRNQSTAAYSNTPYSLLNSITTK